MKYLICAALTLVFVSAADAGRRDLLIYLRGAAPGIVLERIGQGYQGAIGMTAPVAERLGFIKAAIIKAVEAVEDGRIDDAEVERLRLATRDVLTEWTERLRREFGLAVRLGHAGLVPFVLGAVLALALAVLAIQTLVNNTSISLSNP